MFEGADAFLLYRMGWRALRFMYRLVWRGVRWIGRSAMRLARFVFRSYDSLLSVATRGCKQAGIAGTLPPCAACWDTWAPGNRTDACRHRCVVPGDVALIPITMAWIGWPLVVPWMFGVTRSLLVPGSALSMALLLRSRGVIQRAWQ